MGAIIFVRSGPGTGFYEVGRTIAHVLNIEITNNPLDLLRRDTVLFVGSIYGSTIPLLFSTALRKKVVLYVTAEGPFNPGIRKFLVNNRVLVVTPSMYSARELIGQGMAVHKVVPHGIDTCELPVLTHNNPSQPYIRILSIAGTDVYKVLGARYLLRAFARSKYLTRNSHLILKVPSSYARHFKELANNLGIHGKVDIISGYLSKSDLYTLMGNADLYVHASLSDAFGLPIIESMAMGTPVVTLNAPPWNEIVNDNVGFLVRVKGEAILNYRPPYRVRIPDLRDLVKVLEDAVSQVSTSLRRRVRDYGINQFNAHKLYQAFKFLVEK